MKKEKSFEFFKVLKHKLEELGLVVVGAALQKMARGTLLLALSLCKNRKVLRTALIVNGTAINNNLAADGHFLPLRTHGNTGS